MAQVAYDVRAWRARRNLARQLESPTAVGQRLVQHSERGTVKRRLAAATSVDELTAIWAEADAAGLWTSDLTATAAARKKALTEGANSPTQPMEVSA